MKMNTRRLRAGDWVGVRTKEEILRTLDDNGCLDGMPFMPEMLAFCGKRFRVYKRAHKTCDTVFPIRSRRVDRAVHLATRCDGSAHGGCQAGCLIFWKEAWLERVSNSPARHVPSPVEGEPGDVGVVGAPTGCGEADVWARACLPDPDGGHPRYVCQATQLPYATRRLAWWDVSQYVEDYWSGNVGLWRMVNGLAYSMYYYLTRAGDRLGLGQPLRWVYDVFHPVWRGTLFPRKAGRVPRGQPTPTVALHLQPGELVRVKSHEEILCTLSTDNRNRGLWWDAEMVPYCGGTYRVLKRVTRIIDEKTGKMDELQNPCMILDSVVCQARYSSYRLFCPRSIYPYWREIWLERIEPEASTGQLSTPFGSADALETQP
jgi:hypothetical protein